MEEQEEVEKAWEKAVEENTSRFFPEEGKTVKDVWKDIERYLYYFGRMWIMELVLTILGEKEVNEENVKEATRKHDKVETWISEVTEEM